MENTIAVVQLADGVGVIIASMTGKCHAVGAVPRGI
jgi:hypothetical protein